MKQQDFYLGVDIGTTSTKAVLYRKSGKVEASHTINYPLHTPDTLVAEQDSEEIFHAVLGVIRETVRKGNVSAGELRLISFSSAMHSLIAVGDNDELLTNSITWADTRAADYARKIKEDHHGHEIYLRTGTPIHPMSPLAKLVWMKEENPEVFNKARKFISIKEYVFHQLFGEYVVDYSMASATGLFNLQTLDWDEAALDLAGISPDQLSEIVPTVHQLRGVNEEHRTYMGIGADVPFVIGATDGVLSNLGVNAIEEGVIAVTIGTSGAIRTVL